MATLRLSTSKRRYRDLAADLKNSLKQNFRLARALPEFFRTKVTVEQAEAEIRRGLESRAERFLELARTRIYDCPDSPYLRLLKIAGCEFSDLQTHVRRDGLEAALEKLAGEGVYLTADEFKGKTEVRRGTNSFRLSLESFDVSTLSPGIITQSSGSSNKPIRSIISLDRIAAQALEEAVFLSAHDLISSAHAIYDAILPSGGGLRNLLVRARLGIKTDRWFARNVPVGSPLVQGYHYLSTYLVVLMGKCYGPGFPRPEFIDIEDVGPIVQWVSEKRLQGQSCCIKTAASNATRIAREALRLGILLEGAKFIVGGEPFTDSKRELIRNIGASSTSHYAFSGGGTLGSGCASPRYTDEVHLNRHTFAVVQHSIAKSKSGAAIRPLLFTTLSAIGPRLLLNVENGDYGILCARDCGCALERAGLTQHLYDIRSYEKFTSEGMNYFFGDLYQFFEKTLPPEFGGGAGDYQLVEEEDEQGQTRLTLRVHPDVPRLDETRLLRRLQEEFAKGSRANEFQAMVWRHAGTFRVRREVPYSSARGKILPLHLARSSR